MFTEIELMRAATAELATTVVSLYFILPFAPHSHPSVIVCTTYHRVIILLPFTYLISELMDMRKHPVVFFPFSKILSIVLLAFVSSTMSIQQWQNKHFLCPENFDRSWEVQNHDYICRLLKSHICGLKNHSRYARIMPSYPHADPYLVLLFLWKMFRSRMNRIKCCSVWRNRAGGGGKRRCNINKFQEAQDTFIHTDFILFLCLRMEGLCLGAVLILLTWWTNETYKPQFIMHRYTLTYEIWNN